MIVTVGGVVLLLIAMLLVAVHPLPAVAVTVYVPPAVTFGAPALQAKPAPLGVSVADGVVQVNAIVVAIALTVGGVVLLLIAMLLVAVQPLMPVAVTVYVPAAVTLGAPDVQAKPAPLGVSVTFGLAQVI